MVLLSSSLDNKKWKKKNEKLTWSIFYWQNLVALSISDCISGRKQTLPHHEYH